MNTPFIFYVTQGRTASLARNTPNLDGSIGGIYNGSETITATVWPADSEAAVLTQVGTPNSWILADDTHCSWVITFVDSQTSTLTPGTYRLEVTAPPHGTTGETGRLFEGLIEVTSAAGSSVPAPPDLISAPYFFKLTSELGWTNDQLEAVPDLITSACDAFRSWCNNPFAQQTYTKEFVPGLDGVVRLDYVPVNQVYYVRGVPQQAMTVTNPSAQIAEAGFTFTGDVQGGQTFTGITLSATTNGVATTTPVAFTSNETVQGIVNAINLVGSGWTASVVNSYGAWPATVLQGGLTAQGCASTDQGATFWIYSQTLNNCHLDHDNGQQTGMLVTGRQGSYLANQWGPGGEELFGDSGQNVQGKVLVSYNAGYAVIPRDLQKAVVDFVKYGLELLATDQIVKREQAEDYSYDLRDTINALPDYIKQVINRYRIVNA